MTRKSLLTASALLALVAISSAAHAGPTITSYNYWPNDALVAPSAQPTPYAQAVVGDASRFQGQTYTTGQARRAPKRPNR
jgi:hypothetical protein